MPPAAPPPTPPAAEPPVSSLLAPALALREEDRRIRRRPARHKELKLGGWGLGEKLRGDPLREAPERVVLHDTEHAERRAEAFGRVCSWRYQEDIDKVGGRLLRILLGGHLAREPLQTANIGFLHLEL
eukprot:6794819-Prymnesium_polylepis.1